jgi:hypothetical protein
LGEAELFRRSKHQFMRIRLDVGDRDIAEGHESADVGDRRIRDSTLPSSSTS